MQQETLTNILMLFGYPPEKWELFQDRVLVLPPEIDGTISRLLGLIEKIDSQLESALGESMAIKVGDLSLNYAAHTRMLKGEGSRSLKQISSLTRIPIYHNKYVGHGLITSML